jgi:small conductance mechanosensitive channel
MHTSESKRDITMLPMTRRLIDIPLILLLSGMLLSSITAAYADDSKPTEEANDIERILAEIDRESRSISTLEKRLVNAEDLTRAALESRHIRSRLNLMEHSLSFIRQVAEQEKASASNEENKKQALTILESQLQAFEPTITALRARIVLPKADASASERAAIFSQIFEEVDRMERVYQIQLDSIEVAPLLGRNVDTQREALQQTLLERAETGSVLLEMATSDIKALRASVAVVPDDAESKARLTVLTSYVTKQANVISNTIAMMGILEMDTTEYQNQLLATTGKITTDLFQIGVVTNLLVGWSETLWNGVIESGPGLIFNLFMLLIIIFIFYKLAGLAHTLTERGLEDSRFKLSQLLKRMVASIVRNTVLILGVLIALSQIGFSLGPLLAGMGLVGFVVGFALQDTLSNFAAGMLILIYRPFDVDDVIEAGGVSGLVSEMSLVNTTFLTFDNQTIIVPNGKIWGDVIKNVTAQTMRRIDLVFGIAYSDDIEKAERVMAEVVAANPAVLDDPPTMIRLHELGDSSVNYVVRPWVNKDDYWETFWALNRAMKMRFDEEGISIPFPQRDVHLFKE